MSYLRSFSSTLVVVTLLVVPAAAQYDRSGGDNGAVARGRERAGNTRVGTSPTGRGLTGTAGGEETPAQRQTRRDRGLDEPAN